MHDPHALAHLFHADEITIIAVTDRTRRDVELQIRVAKIRRGLAQVVLHAAGAQVRTAQAVINRHLLRDDADVARAVHPDAVAREQGFRFVDVHDDFLQKLPDLIHPARRQIARHAADARVAGGKARTRQRLEQIVELLAFRERVHEHGQRADIHREAAHAQQMRRDAGEFAAHDADVLAARRQRLVDAHQLLDGERVSDVAGERREVIQSIRVRDELGVSHVLRDLLVTAMEVADVGHRLGDDLAVHLEQDAQHAVRGRMRRPHVEDHLLALHVTQFAGSRSFRRTRRRFAKLNVLNGCHSQKISDQHHHYYAGRSQNCRDRQNHTHTAALAGRSCCKLLRLFRVKFGG